MGLGPAWLPHWSASPPGNRLFASFSCHCAADKHCPGFNRTVSSSAPSAAPSMGRHRAIVITRDTPRPPSSSGTGKQCQLLQHAQPHPPNLSLECFWELGLLQNSSQTVPFQMDRHTAFLVLLPCLQQGCPAAGTLQCPHGWHASAIHLMAAGGSWLRHSLVPPVMVAVVPHDVLHRCQDVVKGLEQGEEGESGGEAAGAPGVLRLCIALAQPRRCGEPGSFQHQHLRAHAAPHSAWACGGRCASPSATSPGV